MLWSKSKERKFEVGGLELKPVSIADADLFHDWLAQSDYSHVSYFGTWYYMCARNFEKDRASTFLYTTAGDWLLTFESDAQGIAVKNSPVNRRGIYDNMASIYKTCFGMVSKLNRDIGLTTHRAYNINMSDVSTFLDEKLLGQNQPNYPEFIFRCDDLINLEGRQYKSQRHTVNRFKENYPDFLMREYDPATDEEAVLKIYTDWIASYEDRYGWEAVVQEPGLVTNTFRRLTYVTDRYRIFVCELSGKVEGFIVIVPFCKNAKCVLVEHANLNISGLADFMWYEALRRTTDLGEYENDGTGGKEDSGLFAYKSRHRPVDFYRASELVLNRPRHKISRQLFR